MLKFIVGALLLLAAPAIADTVNTSGGQGLTSYITFPFQTAVYQQGFNASPGLQPVSLFAFCSGSTLSNSTNVANAVTDATAKMNAGTVPYAGMQRYDDTYQAAQPSGTYATEPTFVTTDRAAFVASTDACAYTAWATWMTARSSLFLQTSTGTKFWFNNGSTAGASLSPTSGAISPIQPIASGDWSLGGSGPTYGDWVAQQYATVAAATHAYGIALSDYSDSSPCVSYVCGFNPELVAAFAASVGQVIPGSNTTAQAAYIVASANGLYNKWNDFIAAGYGRFYQSLNSQIATATGHQAFIADQCGLAPAQRRLYGTDQRIIKKYISPQNYVCIWDNQTIQTGRSCASIIWALAGPVVGAAYEPDVRNGINNEASDASYTAGVAACNPGLSGSDQTEKGLKDLKRIWLESAWAHIATRQGTVRRALAFASKDYSDAGSITAILQTLCQTIVPTKPFGYALYYSDSDARTQELAVPAAGVITAAYMDPSKLTNFKNGGGILGYYVSDAAINAIPSVLGSAPAAWVVLDGTLTAAEYTQLTAIAPVLTNLSQAQTFPGAPLTMTTNLSGTGFYDQSGRLIVTVTNLTSATIGSGTVTIQGLPVGTYNVTEMFSNTVTSMTVTKAANGTSVGTLPINITRWDTFAFAIAPTGAG